MAALKVAAFLGIITALVAVLIAWYMNENFDLETLRGKKVVICGASTGIGEELAYQYAKLGAQLLLVARREEELKKVVALCGELGAQTANYVVADLSSLEAAKYLAEEANKLFDGPDVLVLNHLKPFYELWNENSSLEKVPQYFAVNTISYINIATLMLPGLQKTNGSIVVVSSFVGVAPVPRVSTYCGNKQALHGFFNSLRQDLALQGQRGISVTLCVLGFIETKNARAMTKGLPVEKGVKREAVDECALSMIKGAALRKRQMYFPWYLSFVETVHFFFPSFVESVIQVATNEKPMTDIWEW
ncbi:corticosteroid 11-beta-dehydrogenase isozyme 1-like [Stylophora pistillata]|uniref:Hydroxysteroid 11-beta-dehydrogenase 1-like protein n=1 Tax=Stylophora pistillata TaxID=50429 RepID=A0A2B4RSZ8_STYPI|nr:corticosteroid 11-beta-dehydrogenase isozyme 1-like [Stylophora pistillata]PFX20731.1 Hydroxysteroid 11-beta-dehydrogenase 1-like protein [Stylophora pistillata]